VSAISEVSDNTGIHDGELGLLRAVFSQGDEGKSWYIIMKGSVNVVIYGKVGQTY